MLQSIKRAYDRGAFKNEFPGPIDLESTEIYLQILKPAYKVSIGFQKNSSYICDIIPNILKLIEFWQNIVNSALMPTARRLCRLLIMCVKKKFDYELN